MFQAAVAAAIVLLAGDSSDVSRVQSSRDSLPRSVSAPAAVDDTVRKKRPVAVEYSEWYSRRLATHKWSSYTMLPLFAGNYITGGLLKNGNEAPAWATSLHGPLATGPFSVRLLDYHNLLRIGGWTSSAPPGDPVALTAWTRRPFALSMVRPHR